MGEIECLRIDSGVRQGCIMSSWLFNVYLEAGMKEMKWGWGGWEREEIVWPLVYI